jgi:hypothetical protein
LHHGQARPKQGNLPPLGAPHALAYAVDPTACHRQHPLSRDVAIDVAVAVNGHLSSSNSDVRAGNNFERHTDRWTGFNNWWRGFFGGRQERASEAPASDNRLTIPKAPRVGRKTIDVMVNDFLNAWLVEGDIVAAMGYVSERSYACLAQESDNPWDFDRGIAPFPLMINLKSARDSLEKPAALDGLIVAHAS